MTTVRTQTLRRRALLMFLALVMAFGYMQAAAEPAEAADSCGYTGWTNSTFSSFGITLWRHEARGIACTNGSALTDARPYRNDIVKVGVGTIYNNNTWDYRGYVPASTTWNSLYGQAGMYVNVFGQTIGISRTRRVTYDWSLSGGWPHYSWNTSGWTY